MERLASDLYKRSGLNCKWQMFHVEHCVGSTRGETDVLLNLCLLCCFCRATACNWTMSFHGVGCEIGLQLCDTRDKCWELKTACAPCGIP